VIVSCQVSVPYVPTFLSFREYPPLSLAFSALQTKPDLCFVDAHGKAHPRKMGAASHFGVLKQVPTIGVAKRKLCGQTQSPHQPVSSIILDDEVIGVEILTKLRAKPIYVSVGHRISLETAIKITKECTTKYRLPEPIRLAHRLATQGRQELLSRGGSL
jgi:deoxyribonuclease V